MSSMIWINLLLVLVAASISAVIVNLLIKKQRDRRVARGVVFLAGFLILFFLGRQIVLPKFSEWKDQRAIEKSLNEISAFRQIAKYDPKAYQQITSEIRLSIMNRENRLETMGRIRKIIGELITKYLSRASDDAVIRYVSAMTQEIDELAAKDPELCYRFLMQGTFGTVDATTMFRPETQQADLAALADVIRTAVESPQREPDRQASEALLKGVTQRFYEAHGDQVHLLRKPLEPGIDKGKYCTLVAELYKEVLKLPREESGLVLRYMLSGKK